MRIIVKDNLGNDVTNDREWYINTEGNIFYYTGDIDGPLYIVDNDYTWETVVDIEIRNKYDDRNCPECGFKLYVYYDGPNATDPDNILIRHCEECDSDWESDWCWDGSESKLRRKFWG